MKGNNEKLRTVCVTGIPPGNSALSITLKYFESIGKVTSVLKKGSSFFFTFARSNDATIAMGSELPFTDHGFVGIRLVDDDEDFGELSKTSDIERLKQWSKSLLSEE